MSESTIAALQIGASPQGKAATLEHIFSFEKTIKDAGASVVILPEALLGGYPKGEIFGTYLGYRQPQGRAAFARYYDKRRRWMNATSGRRRCGTSSLCRRATTSMEWATMRGRTCFR